MVDGYGSDGPPGLLLQSLQSVDLSFGLAESYGTSSLVQEALELWVESSELALKAVVEKQDAELLQSVVAPTRLTLKLSFYDLAPVLDVPSNGSDSSPS